MIWEKKIHTVPPEKRLLPGAGFPPGIEQAHRSKKPVEMVKGGVYYTPTLPSMSRVLYTWAPYLDSALCVSAEHLSEYGVLSEWVNLFERDLRAALLTTDILFIINLNRALTADKDYVLYLIGRRLRSDKITAINNIPNSFDDAEDIPEILSVE